MNPEPIQRARTLVLRYGWNATAYQLLNPGIRLWFSAEGDAVVGYVERGRVRVAAGAPVCAAERLPAVAAAFERDAAAAGRRVCYFGVEERLESVYLASAGHATVRLGAQPAWRPAEWQQMLAGHASLRAQLNRARNKGVEVSAWPAEAAHEHPELRRCLEEWLDTRGLPPLHFLVEPDTLARLFDRRVFVARRGGQVVGFLVASPVPRKHGWLFEQLIRGREAPNGTAELMVDAAVRAFAAEGYSYVTLGLAPLSRHGDARTHPAPAWLRLLLAWVRSHGRRFYNFGGLDHFKAKFRPERWEAVYAVSNEPRFSPSTLYAIAAAFCARSPLSTLLVASARAARREARWGLRRLRDRLIH